MNYQTNPQNRPKNYKEILEDIGEDVCREGLQKTPLRASKSIKFLTEGYNIDPDEILKSALFKEDYNQMVLIKNIERRFLMERQKMR